MSGFENFTFAKVTETPQILSAKKLFCAMSPVKRRNVLSGLAVKNPFGSEDCISLANTLMSLKVPVIVVAKWSAQCVVAEYNEQSFELLPFTIENEEQGVTVTKHKVLPYYDEEEEEEEDMDDDVVTSVFGYTTTNESPCAPSRYIADRVAHHIDYNKGVVYTPKKGVDIGTQFIGAVSDVYGVDPDASAEDVKKIAQAPLSTRNQLVELYIGAAPNKVTLMPYTVPDTGEVFPVPQVFSPGTSSMSMEDFVGSIPRIVGNLGGKNSGMGYYAQTHVDGDASVNNETRKLVDYVTDFQPSGEMDAYYTDATDRRKAFGMYYRCREELKKDVLIIYNSRSINVGEIKAHVVDGKVVKGGVLALPFVHLSRLGLKNIGYYSNTSVSIKVRDIDISEGVETFLARLSALTEFKHLQLSVSVPVALRLMKVKKRLNFRPSTMLRTCKIIFDSNVKSDFDEILWKYVWGLQHAYYWRWLSGPLISVMKDIVKLSPRYQFCEKAKQEVRLSQNVMKHLSQEDIAKMKSLLPTGTRMVADEEEEEQIIPLDRNKAKDSSKVDVSALAF